MELVLGFLFRYFWVLGIGVTVGNGLRIWRGIQPEIRSKPVLTPGYVKLIVGYTLWMGIPYILMGIGILWGDIPHIFYFLNPSSGHPFVLLF